MNRVPSREVSSADQWPPRASQATTPEPSQRPTCRRHRRAVFTTLSSLAVLVFGCAHGISPAAPTLNLENFRMVDMSWSYGPETLFWPTATQRFDLRLSLIHI